MTDPKEAAERLLAGPIDREGTDTITVARAYLSLEKENARMRDGDKLIKDAERMVVIGEKRSRDVPLEEGMEYGAIEQTGLTFEAAKAIVSALHARSALTPKETR